MKVQVERFAKTKIKLDRIQKIETSLFIKARQMAKQHQDERPSKPGQTDLERAQIDVIAQLCAMPDLDRLSTLQRYQTSLDRQLSKIMGEILLLKDMPTIVSQSSQNVGNTLQVITSYTNDTQSVVSTIVEDSPHGIESE